jgi:riboflavin biosynthesis pyrimidine reductase
MTADGKANLPGKSSLERIGNPADKTRMVKLRSQVDAILVGAGTIRSDNVALSVPSEYRRERNGLIYPLRVAIMGRYPFPPDRNIFNPTKGGTTIIALPSKVDKVLLNTVKNLSMSIKKNVRETLHFVQGDTSLDGSPSVNPSLSCHSALRSSPCGKSRNPTLPVIPAQAGIQNPLSTAESRQHIICGIGDKIDPQILLQKLESQYDVHTSLLEGGPTIIGAFLEADLIDRYYITICPYLFGGEGDNIITPVGGKGVSEKEARRFELVLLEKEGDWAFLTYQRMKDESRK